MYRFYKHGKDWYYKEKGSETSNHVGEAAMEGVLGVTGSREVRIRIEQPDKRTFYVTVINGFIVKVEYLYEENDYHDKENELGAFINTKHEDQTEFFAN